MIKIIRKQAREKERTGAILVEFALVSPVLFLLIFALIEFSRMVMVQHALTNAAREGCRKATLATTLSASDVDSFVREKLKPSINGASSSGIVNVIVTPTNLSDLTVNTPVTVRVEASYRNLSWIPANSLLFLDNTVIKGTSTMVRE